MKRTGAASPIPKDVAWQLCTEIRQENCGRWSLAAFQCWCCSTWAKGNPEKMCFSASPEYRGCNLVNTCYKRKLVRN